MRRRSLLLTGLALALLAVGAVHEALAGPGPSAAATTTTSATGTTEATPALASVWVTQVNGAVTPVLSDYLIRTMEKAHAGKVAALVIEIDTPGGLDSAMRDIIQAEIDSKVPVVLFVYPQGARAASAGVYILMGSDVAAMAPQTNLGSAHPVSLTGQLDATMSAKVTNDAAAYIRGLATTHRRNAGWAERAVRESVSMTAQEAKASDVVEFVAADLSSLLAQIDGYTCVPKGITLHTAGAPIVQVSMSWRDRFLQAVVDPNIVFILMLIGIYGLIFEFQSPGLGIAGVAGAIALLLAAYSLQLLPVSFIGLALIAVAMVLYVAEVKIQSHGALALAATVALILGGLLLFDIPGSFVRVDWAVIAGAAVVSLAFFMVVVTAVARARRRPFTTGLKAMVGESGKARTRLDPDGQVMVHGELWRAHSEEGSIEAGAEIRVLAAEGMKLTVGRSAANGPT